MGAMLGDLIHLQISRRKPHLEQKKCIKIVSQLNDMRNYINEGGMLK